MSVNFFVDDRIDPQTRAAVLQDLVNHGGIPIFTSVGNQPYTVDCVYTLTMEARDAVRERLAHAQRQHRDLSWRDTAPLDEWKIRNWWGLLPEQRRAAVLNGIATDDMSAGNALADLMRLGFDLDDLERVPTEGSYMRLLWPPEVARWVTAAAQREARR